MHNFGFIQRFRWRAFGVAVAASSVAVVIGSLSSAPNAHADAPAGASTADAPLPARDGDKPVTQVFVSGGARSLLKIAIPEPLGNAELAKSAAETTTRDLTLSSLFQVLDPKSFTANLAAEGMSVDAASWRGVGAEAVVKGTLSERGTRGSIVHVELRLFSIARGADPVLRREYDVPRGSLRTAMHQFDNEIVKWFTGTAGNFGSRLVYSASTGKGQKGVFAIESDGQGLGQLPTVSMVALAPAIGPDGVFYSGGLADGSYSLFRVGNPTPVNTRPGLIFGSAFAGSRMALVVSEAGQSDIYIGNRDGSAMAKVTNGGLNTHPSFGPGGKVAYVSNRGGSPQIYVDGKRISFQGSYNMAPVWCNDPEGTKILFMGRDGAGWDIFSVGADGGNIKRLTQDQGSNTYPACSPDGRSIAFFSSRGGLFLANSQGQNQQKIASVSGESLRWEGN